MKKMTTTEVNDVVGNFVVKLLGLRTKTQFWNIQLPLNENKNNLDEKLNDRNYNKAVMKLHDDGWENSFFTSTDVYMLGHGCGVSQYQ